MPDKDPSCQGLQGLHVDPDDFLRASVEYGPLIAREAWVQHLHLIAGCPECLRRVLQRFGCESLEELAALEDPWPELRRRAMERKGEPLLTWLETFPAEERLEKVMEDPALQKAALVQALLRRCTSLWVEDPRQALAYSELAVAALAQVGGDDDDVLSDFDLDQLAARTWAYHGNVCRILSDLRRAEEAFRRAEAALTSPPYDELLMAEIHALKASLLRDQRRFDAALAEVGESIRLYGTLDEHHLAGRQLLKRSKIRLEAGDYEAALADLERAVEMVDEQRDPRSAYCCTSVRLHLLCEIERFEEARALAPEARRQVEASGSRADVLRVRWCEGLIAAGTGEPEAAEAAFVAVREGFVAAGNAYDAALVSLDLAGVYVQQGRTAEVRQIAAAMLPIFESRDVGPAVLAAVSLFWEAAQAEVLSRGVILRTRQLLKELVIAAPQGSSA